MLLNMVRHGPNDTTRTPAPLAGRGGMQTALHLRRWFLRGVPRYASGIPGEAAANNVGK